MKLADLDFDFPAELVAKEPAPESRICWIHAGDATEISKAELLKKFPAGDILVVNNTRVLKRRVFSGEREVLFLKNLGDRKWEVLFPSRDLKVGAEIDLPFPARMKLIQKGRPQVVQLDRDISESDFAKVADLPLPPYIQAARGERRNRPEDAKHYQTAWAIIPGSLAAPTASLHFNSEDLQTLREAGVRVLEITLHVGLGTFLPVVHEDLNDHPMHFEEVEISKAVWQEITDARSKGRNVWALGTTVARALESAALGLLKEKDSGFFGETNLLIQPGFKWQVVDRLLTNFHQPHSTLLALVAAFSDLATVKSVYSWAIQRQFRFFSYGDLCVWADRKGK